jgi:S1-C subfamily serine protease
MIEPFFPPSTTEPSPPETPPTLASAAPDPAATPMPARRRRRGISMVLAASMLSAALASGATAALVPRPAATATTTAPITMATTTVARVTAAASTSSSVAAIAAAANPAVVTIETTVTSSGGGRSVGAGGTGVGSGFIYNANGYILTAAHVVEGASQITVTLADGRTFKGTVVARDLALDVAVVKVAAIGLPTVSVGRSGDLKIGQTVMAIGDPLGQYPGSVTIGIVSGLDRFLTVADDLTRQARELTGLIQTDAAINPGNSGGPLIDASGAVVGIISAGSSSAQGIGFAVPIDTAAAVMAAARTA